jgi:hypothetical protein
MRYYPRSIPRRMTHVYIVLSLLIFSCGKAADDSNAPIGVCDAADKVASEGPHYVDAIASSNKEPFIEGDRPNSGRPVFDKTFDWKEYERVFAAIEELSGHAEQLWPDLLKHFDDERYCISVHGDDGHNYSVGQICESIVSHWLMTAYSRCVHSDDIYYRLRPPMVFSRIELKEWCEKRKDKHLYELQIEICEWATATVSSKEIFVITEQRDAFLKSVRNEITELRETKKAAPFEGFRHDERFEPYKPGGRPGRVWVKKGTG